MMTSVFDTIENIVGKGEIACTSNCSFSYDVFQRLLSQTRQKVSLRGNGLIIIIIIIFFFFRRRVLGPDTLEPQLSTDETKEMHEHMHCRRDFTEITSKGHQTPMNQQVGFFQKEARRGQHHYFQKVYRL